MKRRIKVAWLGVLLALASCGAGCAGGGVPPSAVTDARAVLNTATVGVDAAGPQLLKLREILVTVCREPLPVLPREKCDEATAAFNAIGLGYDDVSKALDRIDFVITLLEAAQ